MKVMPYPVTSLHRLLEMNAAGLDTLQCWGQLLIFGFMKYALEVQQPSHIGHITYKWISD